MTAVACPVCGTNTLYTARGVTARDYHRVEWWLDEQGLVLARWRTGDGLVHEVRSRPEDVFCQGCHTRLATPSPWNGVEPIAPWPRVFFRGA
jgi:hypothetical protein